MKKSQLKETIIDLIKEIRAAETAPSKPSTSPDRETMEPPTRPEKPPGPRRPLTPPKHAPKTTPKNEVIGGELPSDKKNKIISQIIAKFPKYSKEELEKKDDVAIMLLWDKCKSLKENDSEIINKIEKRYKSLK